ncbi:MAG: putative metal-binding motif-containing protein [Myxococcales bacterium]|nr:putative metal-binding motif-containing protein [Myxococcales bacterium]
MLTGARAIAIWALWLGLWAGGCRDDVALIEIPPLLPPYDAAVKDPIPPGAVLCETDADCDDGVECSKDLCEPGGFCIHAADSSTCSDGIFCNGHEVCDPVAGCRPGVNRVCNDDDVCTIDRCDEEQKSCIYEPRDFDDDGEVDWHCFGGTDCDDYDATRGKESVEICADGVDNDCDDRVDEQLGCGRPEHDSCDDALDISAGGVFALGLAGATADYALACGSAGLRDLAYVFEIDAPRDVRLEARGILSDGSEETSTIAVRESCSDAASELECVRGFPGLVRMRALPAGRYHVIVNSELSSQIVLDAEFSEPTTAPTNQSCKSPLDLGEGGRFEADFVDVSDTQDLPCSFTGSGELVYSVTLDRERDLEVSAISFTGERMNIAIRSACNDPSSTLRCISDAPARGRMHQMPAGTYYVIVESSPTREVDFSLDVALLEPTPPPPGDGCGDPLVLEVGSESIGTLADRQDLINVTCGCSEGSGDSCGLFLRDTVYRVPVTEPTDLRVRAEGLLARLGFDFRSSCGSLDSQLACWGYGSVDARVRNLEPGDYYLVIESTDPASFTVSIDPLPRTVPVAVSGNDTCATAYELPPEGGVFSGDTTLLLSDYEAQCGGGARSRDGVYRLDLAKDARVTASVEAGFDTVLYRFADTGEGAASCDADLATACNDDDGLGGTNSRLDEMLMAGTHYYLVDGFNTDNDGRYVFEVAVAD